MNPTPTMMMRSLWGAVALAEDVLLSSAFMPTICNIGEIGAHRTLEPIYVGSHHPQPL